MSTFVQHGLGIGSEVTWLAVDFGLQATHLAIPLATRHAGFPRVIGWTEEIIWGSRKCGGWQGAMENLEKGWKVPKIDAVILKNTNANRPPAYDSPHIASNLTFQVQAQLGRPSSVVNYSNII
eukprot:s528_g44.t1